MSMHAIQVTDVGGPEAMKLVSLPLPAQATGEDVVVKVAAAGVNFIDTYHRSGLYPVASSPFTLGVEGAGVVDSVGPQVQGLAPGDRVAFITRPPGGSYAEYAVVHASKVAPVPPGMDLDTAAAAMIQGMTATALVSRAAPVRPGEWVLVTAAAGGTGRLVAQLARAAGARVIGTASTPAKAAVAREAGCEAVVMYTEQDLAAEVLRLTGGCGAAAVFDGVGAATFDAALAAAAHLGFVVSYGNASGKVPPLDILRLSRNNVRLMRPALWDFVNTREEFRALAGETLTAVAEGRLKVLVTGRYPLSQAARAHGELQGRATTGKLLLLPGA
ncbi:hypothetical protein HYH03_015376 [Edaphochlamys debaryana]|uniref:Enoyl reductase (ER) domain-containing protein n=1 Tax=Edaphochlamys debaryana TaxID=47281 RepID=A0A835XMA7_9CHLO|nr:hypothetical protein HYH03_015376 [Edaphochlamys debaryana]|eukprot:KAG2485932.1 hypothetical protein HYH03_015376 [Edaphochlamys debaryana]